MDCRTVHIIFIICSLHLFSCNKNTSEDIQPGEESLILSGPISDNEARRLIEEKVGSQTKRIIIEQTSELESVDLSKVNHLTELVISNNSVLQYVDLSELTTVDSVFQIIGFLGDISLDKFEEFGGDGIQIKTRELKQIHFPSLNLTKEQFLQIEPFLLTTQPTERNALSEISIPNLIDGKLRVISTAVRDIRLSPNIGQQFSIHVKNYQELNPHLSLHIESEYINQLIIEGIDSLFAPQLLSLGNFSSHYGLKYIEMPSLESVSRVDSFAEFSELFFENVELKNLNLPAFKEGDLMIGGSLESLSVPGFESGWLFISVEQLTKIELINYQSGILMVGGCSDLVTLKANNFQNGYLVVNGNKDLKSIDIESLQFQQIEEITNNVSLTEINFKKTPLINVNHGVNLYGNALSSDFIDEILELYTDAMPSVENITIWLDGQEPPAPPSASGLENKEKLIKLGNEVVTD